MPQPGLFDVQPKLPPIGTDEFDGETYNKHQDYARLSGQLKRVFELMRDGKFRTLREIADTVGCSEASASSRLRDFRKAKFGAFTVERRRVVGGLYEYQLKI